MSDQAAPGGGGGAAATGRYYVPQLDGLRFIAFFLVFIRHLPPTDRYVEGIPVLHGASVTLTALGGFGVDLFLVLSSFLITTLLLLEYRREGRVSLRDFYLRRTLRIWPLYYFALLLGFLVLPGLGLHQAPIGSDAFKALIRDHLVPFMTFLGNYSTGLLGYPLSRALVHMWTISLEEQFYILWPMMFVLLLPHRRLMMGTMAALMVFTVVMRGYFVTAPFHHPVVWTILPTRLDPLVLGAALGVLRVYLPAERRWELLKLAAGIGILVATTLAPPYREQTVHILWQYLAVAAGFCLILDAAVSGGLVGKVLAARPLVAAGKISYGLYVYHFMTTGLARYLVTGEVANMRPIEGGGFLRWALVAGLALVLTLAVAAASYRLLERPFLKLRLRFSHVPSRPV
jgi:peptidoglycan/LPS O-acetylase OafA/YrhL